MSMMGYEGFTEIATARALWLEGEIAERERVSRIARNWQLYWGRLYPAKQEGESHDHYAARVKLQVNLVRRIIRIKRSFLYGTGVRRQLDDDALQVLFDEIWTVNNFHAFMLRVATAAMIAGTAIVVPQWVPTEDRRGRLIYRMVPAENVAASMDPRSPSEVSEVRVRSTWWEVGSEVAHTKVDTITPTLWHVKVDDARRPELEIEDGRNPYGMIPHVFFRNCEDTEPPWGLDEIEVLDSLQTEFNARLSDANEVIKYHGSPALKAKNVHGDIVVGPDKMVEISGENADLDYLTWNQNMSGVEGLVDRMLSYFSAVSDVPAPELMDLEGIGNLTSGLALRLLYAAPIRTNAEYRMLYEAAEQRLVNSTVRVLNVHTNRNLAPPRLSMGWPADPLPLDEETKLRIFAQRRDLGLQTQADQIHEMHPDWDEATVQAYMAEMAAERAALVAEAAATMTPQEAAEIEAAARSLAVPEPEEEA